MASNSVGALDALATSEEISTAIEGKVLTAPVMREWDTYQYGENGVEIIQDRMTWVGERVETVIIEDGKLRKSRAVPMDFAGRLLVGMTPFGANTPHSVTIIAPHTQHTRNTFNTNDLPGIGGPNVFLTFFEDLTNLRERLPIFGRVKKVFSPLVEQIIESYLDCDDRELTLSGNLWSDLECMIGMNQPKRGRRQKR